MFFNAEEDDQDFMSQAGGSKLAGLFGIDKANAKGGNESLTYTAPKQPKSKESSQSGDAPAVMNAAAVQAYKFVNGQYASQGKLGAAILGTHAAQNYRLLLYASKQQQITNAKISSSFKFTIQANNYASFYDDARVSWSLMFDNEQSIVQFSRQISIAKANSCMPVLDTLITQDLTLGEGGTIENSDSAEVKYTGWLYTNHTFGKVFDSNVSADKLFRFKVGRGKVIKGWDHGVIGMKKNGRRLLIVPPTLAYGSQGMGDRVPPSSTLIFDIEVVRVKLARGDSPKVSPAPTPVPGAAEMVQDSIPLAEDTVKGRTKSISEQLSQSPQSDKAKLISRMAKMGQPMLPMSGPMPDTDDDPNAVASPVQEAPPQLQQKPILAERPVVAPVAQPTPVQPVIQQIQQPQQPMAPQPAFVQNIQPQPSQHIAVYQAPMQPGAFQSQQYQQPFQPPNPYGYQQQQQQPQVPGMLNQQGFPQTPYAAPVPPPSTQPDVHTPVLLSENRQQNTEIRLAVGKVSDKVDSILSKLEHMQVHGGNSLAVLNSSPNLETGILLQNIQRVIQDNERLKKEVFEKSARIESQNEKIADLLQRNQSFVEQSNHMLEKRNDTFKTTAAQAQGKVLFLEQEKVQFATELSAAMSQLSTLQLEMTTLHKKESDLRQQLSSALDDGSHKRQELGNLQQQATEDEKNIAQLNQNLKDEKQHRKMLENKQSQLQEELSDLKTSSETTDKALNDRKKKSSDERRKLEEEFEDSKSHYEQEIQTLKDRLRKQKSSTDAATTEQVSQLEEELNDTWRKKSNKALATAQDKHDRIVNELHEERDDLQQKLSVLDKKLHTVRGSSGEMEQQIGELQEEVEDLSIWKEKYDKLRSQAGTMKERYEDRLSEMEDERDTLQEQVDELRSRPAVVAPVVVANTPVSVVNEVKKIMNSVYVSLREEFDAEESYSGSEVLASILGAIKTTTLKLVQTQQSVGDEEKESEGDEEDGDDQEATQQAVAEVKEEITKESAQPVMASAVSNKPHALAAVAGIEKKQTNSEVQAETPQPVVESSIMPVADHITGDKGNPAHTEHLNEAANEVTAETPQPVVESSISPASDHITGDKGNPAHTELLDQAANEVPTETPQPVVESSISPATDHITGDKGNPAHTELLDQAANEVKAEALQPVVEGSISPESDHITGDKGNPAHTELLDQAANGHDEIKPSEATASTEDSQNVEESRVSVVNANSTVEDSSASNKDSSTEIQDTKEPDSNATKEPSPDIKSEQQDHSNAKDEQEKTESSIEDKPKPIDAQIDPIGMPAQTETAADHDSSDDSDIFQEATDKPISKPSTERKEAEKDKTQNAVDDVSPEIVPAMASMEPPPMPEEIEESKTTDDSPLFGEDDTIMDTFGTDFKPKVEESSTDKKLTKDDLAGEDDLKPVPPPPLFGDDDDDDDDLDWLS